MKRVLYLIVAIMVLSPGCTRVSDWVMDSWYQGKAIEAPLSVAWRHMRFVTVYDQMDTVGIFDALLLSDEVRTAYAEMYGLRQGKGGEQCSAMLRRQLEENNHFISFYLLSSKKFPTDSKIAQWSLFLETSEGVSLQPVEITEVELPQEYILMFGEKYNRFRTPYLVKFNALTLDDSRVISKNINWLALRFRSTIKEVSLVWDFDNNHNIIEPRVYGRGSVVNRHDSCNRC